MRGSPMKRSYILPVATLLTLSVLAPLALPSLGSQAIAQTSGTDSDRAKKEERRVLSARDVDPTTQMSEVYRAAARQKRHESMEFLKQIIAERDPKGEQRAEMMLRLADLYFEEGRDIYLTEMQSFEGEYDKCFNTKGCDPEKMKANNIESRKWQDKSIKLYKQILDSYPQYARADEATFYLGSALQDTDQRDEAINQFLNLVKMYPESKYVPDSYVLIGEYYFDNNNAFKALQAYKHAASFRDSDKYPFAMYKLAWCYYNVGEYSKAIDTMKAVVAIATPAPGEEQTAKSKLQLQDEALKDLVRFFADAGQMDEAYDYFKKLGKDELIQQMLKRLAQTYFEQGKFEQCITTYRRLISENPQGTAAPEFQNEIVAAYQKMGKKQETVEEIDKLLKSYGKNSAWARTNSANQDAVKAAQDYLEKNLRTVAINYHEEAKKLGTGKNAQESYALAYKSYTVYLNEFPDSKYSYDVRYAFSELLYKLKKYDEAYTQYMKVVEIDPKGQHSKFCAESAIFAADEMVKTEAKASSSGSPDPGKKTDAIPLTPWEENLIKACDQWTNLFKDDKKTKNIIYKSAYILYNKNQFKLASDRFRIVIGLDPGSKEAEQAANLILDSFNLVEDWANLKEISKAFYDQKGLGSDAFKKEVYNIYERSSFKLVDINYQKTKDAAVAADAYMAFYGEFPSSEVADQALNNASVYFRQLALVDKEMNARQTLIDKFPKSKYYNDHVAELGFLYEGTADFGSAANWYEKLFSLSKDHAAAKEALYSASLFRKALGQWEVAIKDYQQFITAYPTDARVPSLTIEIGKIYEDHSQWDPASKVYYTFFTKPPAGGTLDQVFFSRLHYGLTTEKIGGAAAAKLDKHYKETIALYQAEKAKGTAMELAPEFVGEIMFKLATPTVDRYMAMQINGPTGKVNRKQEDAAVLKSLTDKARALQEVEKLFLDIVTTGAGQWGLASLVKLGQAYENMGDALRNSHIPSYLTPEQVELYRIALEDKVFVQTEKAVEAYKLCLDKSYQLSLYNDNTAFATRRLGDLRPTEYPSLEERLLTPRYTSKNVVERTFIEQP